MIAIINTHSKPRAFAIQLISYPSWFDKLPDRPLYISQNQDQIEIGMLNFTGTYAIVYAIMFKTKEEAFSFITTNIADEVDLATMKKTGNVITLYSRIDGGVQFLVKEINSKYLQVNQNDSNN